MPSGVLYSNQGLAADGSQVRPGCTGKTVLGASEDTTGVGRPVAGSTGDRVGDHNGHRVLYGGRAIQF